MTIKALPTEYKGILFRSRLEARWAVYFDEMNIAWEWEPEGFDLDGVWYLPDFRLSTDCDGRPPLGGDIYVEVKHEHATPEAFIKAELFARVTEQKILRLAGTPQTYRNLVNKEIVFQNYNGIDGKVCDDSLSSHDIGLWCLDCQTSERPRTCPACRRRFSAIEASRSARFGVYEQSKHV